MNEMKFQMSELAENAKLALHFDLEVDVVSEMLSETGFKGEKATTDITIERVGNSNDVRLSADIEFEVSFLCGRCLEVKNEKFAGQSEFVLMPKSNLSARANANDEIELEPADLDIVFHDSESIALKPLIREAMLETLPAHNLCSDSFSDQCRESFEKNIGESAAKDLEIAQVDLRWGPLLKLKKNLDKD